jgi:formylglycine-generating enzyme required for sulfatase activity
MLNFEIRFLLLLLFLASCSPQPAQVKGPNPAQVKAPEPAQIKIPVDYKITHTVDVTAETLAAIRKNPLTKRDDRTPLIDLIRVHDSGTMGLAFFLLDPYLYEIGLTESTVIVAINGVPVKDIFDARRKAQEARDKRENVRREYEQYRGLMEYLFVENKWNEFVLNLYVNFPNNERPGHPYVPKIESWRVNLDEKAASTMTNNETVAASGAFQTLKDCAHCPELVVIPQGSYYRGSQYIDVGGYSTGPRRRVAIGYRLAVGKYEVTQGEWRAVMGSNPSIFKDAGDRGPVEYVAWGDTQEYLKKLNATTGKNYRLLTEAEWEYAARAGTTTRFSFGKDISSKQANYDGRKDEPPGSNIGRPIAVGSFAPNAWGLHDMHGNVYEWVQDCNVFAYSDVPTDGSAAPDKSSCLRGNRGGAWHSDADGVQSATRNPQAGDTKAGSLGFRIARTLP